MLLVSIYNSTKAQSIINGELKNLLNQSLQYFPKVKEVQQSVQLAEDKLTLTELNKYPDITLDASYAYVQPKIEVAFGEKTFQFAPVHNVSGALNGTYTLIDFGCGDGDALQSWVGSWVERSGRHGQHLLAVGVEDGLDFAADDVHRGHHHAGRAETALQAMVLAERLLHRMQRTVRLGEAFDRDDGAAVSLKRQRGAGLHRNSIKMDDAAAALRGVAADVGAGQPQVLTQKLHKQRAGIDIGSDGLAVHRHGNGWHRHSSQNCPGLKGPFPIGNRTQAPKRTTKSDRFSPISEFGTRGSLNFLSPAGQAIPAKPVPKKTAYFTAAANLAKKSSAIFFAAPLTSRWPSWASLPPICASTL